MDKGGGGGGGNKYSDENSLESCGVGVGGHHHHHFYRQVLRNSIFFSVVAVSCLVLYHSAYPFQFLPNSVSNGYGRANLSSLGNEDKLESVLRKAAMEDKTIIVTTLNDAWTEPNSIFDIFLESFRIGNQTQRLLNHLVVIALDEKAYARCVALHPHCFALTTQGIDFSGEAYFGTSDYLDMMWRRIVFLQTVLQRGYNFIFTDADILWFRDPFPRFYPDADFQIACDQFRGNSSDLNNSPNGGFNYVKSNNKTIQFYKFWNTSRETFPGMHDQDVLNQIKHDPFIRDNLGLELMFLDTAFFGGFCEPSRDFNEVCTMHANCCFGLPSKVLDLTLMLEDWRKYMALAVDEKASNPSFWSVPKNCSTSYNPPNSRKKNDEQGSKN